MSRNVTIKFYMDSGESILGIYKTENIKTDDIMREIFQEDTPTFQKDIIGFGRPRNPREGNIYIMMNHVIAVEIL